MLCRSLLVKPLFPPAIVALMTRAVFSLFLLLPLAAAEKPRAAVLVSDDAEWREVKQIYPRAEFRKSPYGEYFFDHGLLVFQGGWGKISAAASTQYVIDRWNPATIINLGTCGGIAGRIERFANVLVTKTVVYDIIEQMGDAQESINFYSTPIDLSWLAGDLPLPVVKAPLYSADRDLVPGEIASLVSKYDAVAVDWESGAIAWVARRNGKRILILRGVSDLVSAQGGEAYGKVDVYVQGTGKVMRTLFAQLPALVKRLPRY